MSSRSFEELQSIIKSHIETLKYFADEITKARKEACLKFFQEYSLTGEDNPYIFTRVKYYDKENTAESYPLTPAGVDGIKIIDIFGNEIFPECVKVYNKSQEQGR